MMYQDIDRYFSIWKKWTGMDRPTAALLAKRYGAAKFHKLMEEKGILIEGEDNHSIPRNSMYGDIPL